MQSTLWAHDNKQPDMTVLLVLCKPQKNQLLVDRQLTVMWEHAKDNQVEQSKITGIIIVYLILY